MMSGSTLVNRTVGKNRSLGLYNGVVLRQERASDSSEESSEDSPNQKAPAGSSTKGSVLTNKDPSNGVVLRRDRGYDPDSSEDSPNQKAPPSSRNETDHSKHTCLYNRDITSPLVFGSGYWRLATFQATLATTAKRQRRFAKMIKQAFWTSLPCPECKKHFAMIIARRDPEDPQYIFVSITLDDGQILPPQYCSSWWMWASHNDVNLSIGKAPMSWEEFLRQYYGVTLDNKEGQAVIRKGDDLIRLVENSVQYRT